MTTILEVWHGGIPASAPTDSMRLCTDPACPSLGAHSHVQRISDAPFSIPWPLWIKHHMPEPPLLVLHKIP